MNILDDCPPGTEGYEDFANNQPNCLTGGTSADEKRRKLGSFLQSHSIKLDNGNFHAALDYVEQDNTSAYLCFPCGVTCYTEITLQGHLNGKAHANKLSHKNVYPSSILTNHPFFKINKPNTSAPASALPDNVPPPAVKPAQEKVTSKLWLSLQNYKQSPIIGLEYILELTDDSSKSQNCFCALCEKRGDSHTIVNHLIGAKHKIKYLQIHYPTAYRGLLVYLNVTSTAHNRGITQVILNICNRIEQTYGRLPPTIVDNHEFVTNRVKCLKACSQVTHFSERDGQTFEDLVDGEYITLFSEKGPVNVSSNQPNAASGSLMHMKFSSPPKTVQQQRAVNIKDPIKITIKSTSMSFDKAQEERDLRNNLNEMKASKRNYLGSVSPPSDSRNDDGHGYNKRSSPFHRLTGNSRERNYRERRSPGMYRRSGYGEDRGERGRSRSPVRRSPRRSRSPRYNQHLGDKYNSSHGSLPEEPKRLIPEVLENCKMTYKLDVLQRKMEEGLEMLTTTYKYYEKNPEKHPLYQEEWKTYWNKRYKELKAANTDMTQFDFKPEWIVFWEKRMKELHLSQIETLKLELCRSLNLYTTEPKFSNHFKFMNKTTTLMSSLQENTDKSRKASPPPTERRHELQNKGQPESNQSFPREGREEREQMNDRNGRDRRDSTFGRDGRDGRNARGGRDGRDGKDRSRETKSPRNKERRFAASRRRDDSSDFSPWDDDNSVDSVILVSSSKKGDSMSRDSKSASVRGRDVISKERERSYGRSAKPAEFSEFKSDKMEIYVISVLRLLTALENYLGSLGSKVVDLLTVALRMEKDKPNSSDDILLDDTYNVLFETVKEKLKGQLLAGLVESNAIQATKTAIQNTASLLHKGTKLAATRKLMEEQEKLKSKHMPVKVEGIGKVEKAAIAKQIAAALIAQGKTSVTTEELETLVNAVVGMAKTAQTTQTPAAPAGFLTKLTNHNIEKMPALTTHNLKDFSKEPENSGTNALQMLQSAYTQNAQASRASPKPPPDGPTGMEGLSDSDLKTLLQNFKDLSSDEQHGLIAYLKKLEFKEPKRVEKLRKFVNLDPERDNLDERETSPFSSRECGNNPEGANNVNNKADPEEKAESKPQDSDDEDDYTFDEVFKSASEKLKKEKRMQDELEVINNTLKENSDSAAAALDTQSIISNLMVSFKQGTNTAPDPVQDSMAGGCNADNIAKVLSLINSMAGQDTPVPTPAKVALLPLSTQPPPPPPPVPEAVQMSNQNMPVDETLNFNMRGQSNAMNQHHHDGNNYPDSSQYPQSMQNPDTDFQNTMPRGNNQNDFAGQCQYDEMNYAQNPAFGNGNFRSFPAGMNQGNQYPYGNYQDMYNANHAWNNAQQRMLPQSQYANSFPMEQDYCNSGYDDLPHSNYRGHSRNINRGNIGVRGKTRGRGNMDWRGGFMRN